MSKFEQGLPKGVKNLLGADIGLLTVVGYSHLENGCVYWNLRCACGNYRKMRAGEISRKNPKVAVPSCGCFHLSRVYKDLSGRQFCRLKVITLNFRKNFIAQWICECACGEIKSIAEDSLLRGRTKSCGCLAKSKALLAKEPLAIQARIKSNIIVSESGCWEWQRGIAKNGYGCFSNSSVAQRAHRASYLGFKGEIPEGLYVCHHCDNKRCVNPDHLYAGTHADNTRDAQERHRLATGPDKTKGSLGGKNCKAKLTSDQVLEIRRRHGNGSMSTSVLANLFDVNRATIGRIVRRKAWTHV